MAYHIFIAVIMILLHISCWHTSNILFVTVYGSKSHIITLIPAMEALSARGHNVTFLTFLKPHFDKPNNVTVLEMHHIIDVINENKPDHFAMLDGNITETIHYYTFVTEILCKELLNDGNFLLVANDKTKYDVIIMDVNCHECALVLVWLLQSPPLIFYITLPIHTSYALALDLPTPFSHVPLYINPYTDRMKKGQRFINALDSASDWELRELYLKPNYEQIIRSKYESFPSIVDIEQNYSFLFTNTYSLSVDLGRPLAPFVAEVGGTHCRPARLVAKDVENFIMGAGTHGFIYFSLGTYVTAENMKTKKLNIFLGAFKRLKQRVIWKFESDIPDLPDNVYLMKEVDQQDILGHSNIKAFVTQGGQLSIQEALYHNVPMVVMAICGDQQANMANLGEKGLAEILHYKNLSEDLLYEALQNVIYEPSYREKSKYYSQLMKDRPMSAIDTTIYWVEYVIRHKGAHHLSFNNKHLHWTQYFLLDVICLTLVVILVIKKLFFFLHKKIRVHY